MSESYPTPPAGDSGEAVIKTPIGLLNPRLLSRFAVAKVVRFFGGGERVWGPSIAANTSSGVVSQTPEQRERALLEAHATGSIPNDDGYNKCGPNSVLVGADLRELAELNTRTGSDGRTYARFSFLEDTQKNADTRWSDPVLIDPDESPTFYNYAPARLRQRGEKTTFGVLVQTIGDSEANVANVESAVMGCMDREGHFTPVTTHILDIKPPEKFEVEYPDLPLVKLPGITG